MKKICSYLLSLLLIYGLVGCSGDRLEATPTPNEQLQVSTYASTLLEVATPKVIQQLHDRLDRYHPEVAILSPQADRVFDDTTVSVKFQVKDLPIFKNSQLDAGNHLNVILDNEPARQVYNLDESLILENLAAGTHNLRVFAVRPWEESFKNEGAFAQTTFHILTKTGDNTPDPKLPLLTYNSPSGIYGAEPIMLDFYLNNAPLHLVAKQDPADEIEDWRIRITVNGKSFVLDNWQPVYLKGFQKGKNWVQIEYINENGQNVPNTFNNTVRVITYDPREKNTLAKLVKNELPLEIAQGIIEPSYIAPVVPTPEPEIEELEPEVTPTIEEIAPTQETETTTEAETKIEQKPIETIIENQEKVEQKQPVIPEIIQTEPTQTEVTIPVTPNAVESETEPTIEPKTMVEEKQEIKEEETIEPSVVEPTVEPTQIPKSFQLPKIQRPKWFDENVLDRLN
jgi:hypothetical protein